MSLFRKSLESKKSTGGILVSVRMPRSMTYLQKRLGIENQPIICYNGALVLEGEKMLFSNTIEFKSLERVHRLAQDLGIRLGLYRNGEWYGEESTERVQKEINCTRTGPGYRPTTETLTDWKAGKRSADKIMPMGTKNSTGILFSKMMAELSTQLHVYRSNDTLIELAPKTVSKLSAIRFLRDADRSMADVISFGDNYNDIEMIKHSGLGVAVGNARNEVKAIAQYVSLKNTEDGVAHFLRQQLI